MSKKFQSITILLAMLAFSTCGGGDGGNSEPLNLTSLTGVYQITSVETNDATRTVDVSEMGIYYILTNELVARYGMNDVCYDYSLVTNESTDGDTVTATIQPQEGEPGVPTCISYLANVASTTRSNTLTDEEAGGDQEREEAITALAKGLSIIHGEPLSESHTTTAELISFAKATSDDSLANFATFIAGVLADNDGDDGGDDDSSDKPQVLAKCDGVQHFNGFSVVKLCLKLKHIKPSDQVVIELQGNRKESRVDASGVVCAEFRITRFGNYAGGFAIFRGAESIIKNDFKVSVDAKSRACKL